MPYKKGIMSRQGAENTLQIKKSGFKKCMEAREFTLAILLLVIIVLLSVTTRDFANPANVRVLLLGMSSDLIIAVPMGISLIAGNIDFSVGSTMGLASVLGGMIINATGNALVGIVAALLIGAVLGIINAVMICHLHVTPLVATLGTWMAYKGLQKVIAANAIANFPTDFFALGRTELNLFGVSIPISIIYMLVVFVVGIFVLKKVNFFHNAYFIGSNKDSARLAGINITKFTYISYMITGILAAFAGMVLVSRLGTASQTIGSGLEFRIVVALLVGGLSMDGGEGSMIGIGMGVLLMQIISNALVLTGINPNYSEVIIGAILVLSVGIDQINKRRRAKARA